MEEQQQQQQQRQEYVEKKKNNNYNKTQGSTSFPTASDRCACAHRVFWRYRVVCVKGTVSISLLMPPVLLPHQQHHGSGGKVCVSLVVHCEWLVSVCMYVHV